MSHKKFQHFINWFGIFIRAKTNMQKKKGKIKQKIKRKTYLSPRRSRPSQPTRLTRGTGVFFPAPRTQAAQWNATEPAGGDTSPPSAFQASPCPLLAHGDALKLPHSFLPLHELPPLLSRPFRRRPRRTPERRRAPAWPPCSPRHLELSRGTAAVVFVFTYGESSQEAPETPPSSPSRRRPP